jgi:sugar-specific transcriptional regulator TrmB
VVKLIEEELIQKLRRLGFTTYEARVYLTLLKYGSLTSTEIVKLAKIPQARFYDTIERLASKGLVKFSKSRPTKYSIVDPARALRSLTQKEIEEKFKLIEDFLKSIAGIPRREMDERYVWVMSGLSGITSTIEDVIENAKDEILIATYSYIVKDIVRKIRDSISTCLIIYDKYEDIVDNLEVFDEVWFKPTLGPTIIISDLTRGVLIPRTQRENPIAYLLEDPEILVPIIGYYFYLRETSNKLIYRLGDVVKKRTFRSLLRAVEMINNMREKKLKIFIEVDGVWVKSKKQDSLRGNPINIIRDKLREITTMILERDDGSRVTVGGIGAIYEDFEAHRITVYGD